MNTGPIPLSEVEYDALARAARLKLLRRPKGFRAGSGTRVSLAVADRLLNKGLATLDYNVPGGPRLVVTSAGRLQYDLLTLRRQRIKEQRDAKS